MNALGTATSQNRIANKLRGLGPLGVAAILLIVFSGNGFIGAVLVLLWRQLSHTQWADIGFTPPRSWINTVAVGIASGVALKFLMKAVVMPLLGAAAVNPAYHFLTGNVAAVPRMILVVMLSAAFGEETVYRGFLFERLGKILGSGLVAKALIVLVTSALFATMHYPDQRLAGVEQAAVTGLILGTIFAITRSVYLPMVVHAAYDLTALAMIYWNLEDRLAHLVFH